MLDDSIAFPNIVSFVRLGKVILHFSNGLFDIGDLGFDDEIWLNRGLVGTVDSCHIR